jgi:hypothetical protein
MVTWSAVREGDGMIFQHQNERAVTASAEQLADAAAMLRRNLVEPDAIDALPATLAHIAGVVDDLAGGVVVLAEAVAKSSGGSGTSADPLPPEHRALCWHLHEFAARLRAARASAETARSWAPEAAARRADVDGLAGVGRDRPKLHA